MERILSAELTSFEKTEAYERACAAVGLAEDRLHESIGLTISPEDGDGKLYQKILVLGAIFLNSDWEEAKAATRLIGPTMHGRLWLQTLHVKLIQSKIVL